MSRHRWLRAKWPITIRALAKNLKAKPFGNEQMEGFVIDRIRDDFLEARYIERFLYIENVVDPFGREQSFERLEFRQCEFRATNSGPGLELIDAPKSVQGLISRLTEATNFSLSINPLSIDVMKWSALFQNKLNISTIVDSLQIGALLLTPGISAKAVLKGEKDVLEAAVALTKGRPYSIEKIQLRTERRGTVLLTNSAIAKVDVDNSDEIIEILRNSLNELLA